MNNPANPVVCPHCGCREHTFSKRAKVRPYTCAACRMRFGSTANQAFNYLENTISFQFGEYGWGAPACEFYIDQDLVILSNIEEKTQCCVIPITRELYREFLQHLYDDIHLLDWKADYFNPEVCDGTDVEIRVRIAGKREVKIHCINEFPYAHDTLYSLMCAIIARATEAPISPADLPTMANRPEEPDEDTNLDNCFITLQAAHYHGLTVKGTRAQAQYDLCRAIAANYLGKSEAFEGEMTRVMDADLIPADIFIQAEDGILDEEFGDNPSPEELQRAEETGELIQNGVYGGIIICPSFGTAYECGRYNREHPNGPRQFCL